MDIRTNKFLDFKYVKEMGRKANMRKKERRKDIFDVVCNDVVN